MRQSARIALAWLLVACGGDDAPHTTPAATVKNPVTEPTLTSVVLTPQAVFRLGIETVTVESTTVAPSRTVGGEVVIPPGQTAGVSAPTSGIVLSPASGDTPRAGTHVTKDQPLLRFVSLPPDRDLARVQADVTVAEARLRQARAESQRVARLFADRLVSAREHERVEAELVAATSARDVALAQLHLVQGVAGGNIEALTALVLTAPAGGVVRQMFVTPGQTVAAGTPLAEVIDVTRLWIRVPVYAGEVGRFSPSGAARVHGIGGAGMGVGIEAARIAAPPAGDAAAASIDFFYEVRDAGGALSPGERVSVTIPLAGVEGRGLVVPMSAVVRDMSGGAWVYERTDSVTFIRRRVEVAAVRGGLAVLSRGLRTGVKVVIAGAAELFGTEFGAGH